MSFSSVALLHIQKVLHKGGELGPSNAIDLPRVSGNFSRILVQDLAAPISLPQPSSPRGLAAALFGAYGRCLQGAKGKRGAS